MNPCSFMFVSTPKKPLSILLTSKTFWPSRIFHVWPRVRGLVKGLERCEMPSLLPQLLKDGSPEFVFTLYLWKHALCTAHPCAHGASCLHVQRGTGPDSLGSHCLVTSTITSVSSVANKPHGFLSSGSRSLRKSHGGCRGDRLTGHSPYSHLL